MASKIVFENWKRPIYDPPCKSSFLRYQEILSVDSFGYKLLFNLTWNTMKFHNILHTSGNWCTKGWAQHVPILPNCIKKQKNSLDMSEKWIMISVLIKIHLRVSGTKRDKKKKTTVRAPLITALYLKPLSNSNRIFWGLRKIFLIQTALKL